MFQGNLRMTVSGLNSWVALHFYKCLDYIVQVEPYNFCGVKESPYFTTISVNMPILLFFVVDDVIVMMMIIRVTC